VITTVAPMLPKWLRTHDSVDWPALYSAGNATNTFSIAAATSSPSSPWSLGLKTSFVRWHKKHADVRLVRYKRLWTRDSDTMWGGSQQQATVTYRGGKEEVPKHLHFWNQCDHLSHQTKKTLLSYCPGQLTDSSNHLWIFCWFNFQLIESTTHGMKLGNRKHQQRKLKGNTSIKYKMITIQIDMLE
jgi:hypothetical protein